MDLVYKIIGIISGLLLAIGGYMVSAGMNYSFHVFLAGIFGTLLTILLYIQEAHLTKKLSPLTGNKTQTATKSTQIETVKPLLLETAEKKIAKPKKEFVKIRPEQIMAFYKDRTSSLAEKMLEPYKGKWITVSGKVTDVILHKMPGNDSFVQVLLNYDNSGEPRISAAFENPVFMQQAQALLVGEQVTLIGRIRKGEYYGIGLDDCEIKFK